MAPPTRNAFALCLLIVASLFAGCGGGGGGSGPVRTAAPAPAPPSPAPLLSLAAVGDTHGNNLPPGDPLGRAADVLRDVDLFLFNHEGVIRTAPEGCAAGPNQTLFVAGPDFADFLAPARESVATLANNHVFDCGETGIEETRAALAARGIETTGTGEGTPLLLRVNETRVAILARLAGLDIPGATRWNAATDPGIIADLAATNDFVVVALHMHLVPSWTDEAAPEHRALVRAAIDAGADLVVGHGSHMPQAVIVRGGGIGLLSLGNFLFRPDYRMPRKAHRSVVAEVAVHADRTEVVLHPFRLDETGRPRLPTAADAGKILQRIADLSASLETTVTIRDGAGYLSIPR